MDAAATAQMFCFRTVLSLTIIPIGAESGIEQILELFKVFNSLFSYESSLDVFIPF